MLKYNNQQSSGLLTETDPEISISGVKVVYHKYL